jgi:hypothetical protein
MGNWRKSTYSDANGGACVEVSNWRKSTHSDANGGDCVEVGTAGTVLVRDTTNRSGTVLSVPAATWTTFLSTLR